MKIRISVTILLGIAPIIHAAGTQIGDFRLSAGAYSGGYTYFDPASGGDLTRSVIGAPVAINSSFIAVTQESDGGTPSTTNDIGLQTFSSGTNIRNLNRFTSDQDGPGAAGGPQRAGMVQWTIDLSPIGGYLSTNSLALSALDLRLVTDPSDDAKKYDVYLSYSNPAESVAMTGVATGLTAGADNYTNFWFPSQGVAEGAIANGTHKVIELNFVGNMNTTIDLLALYNAGVKDFNLIMGSGDFFSGRNIAILDGSGLSIDTIPVPEPSSVALLGLGGLALLKRRRR